MHVHIKLMNTFGNWLMHMALISRTAFCCCKCLVPFGCCAGDDELESLTSARLSCEKKTSTNYTFTNFTTTANGRLNTRSEIHENVTASAV